VWVLTTNASMAVTWWLATNNLPYPTGGGGSGIPTLSGSGTNTTLVNPNITVPSTNVWLSGVTNYWTTDVGGKQAFFTNWVGVPTLGMTAVYALCTNGNVTFFGNTTNVGNLSLAANTMTFASYTANLVNANFTGSITMGPYNIAGNGWNFQQGNGQLNGTLNTKVLQATNTVSLQIVSTQPWTNIPAYSATVTNRWIGTWTNGLYSSAYSNTATTYLLFSPPQ
jgi:hypothetical protein